MKCHRLLGVAVVATSLVSGFLGAAPARAQSAGFRMDTGLHTFAAGEAIRVVVTELGPATAIKVRINIFDEKERHVGTKTANLRRGIPAMLDLRVLGTAPRLLRAQIVFTNASESVPIVAVESLDLGFKAETRVICARPAGRTDPPTSASCPGVVITDLVIF